MGKPSLFYLKLLGHFDGLLQIDVRVVWNTAQGFNDDVFDALKFRHQMTTDLTQVGDIGEFADSEGIAGERIMLHFDGFDMKVAKVERGLINEMHLIGRSTWVKMLFKGIRKLAFNLREGRLVDKQRHRFVALTEDEGANIIQPSDMVFMFMSDKHRIQMIDPFAEHLLTEVGTCINRHSHLIGANQDRSPGPFVTRIL